MSERIIMLSAISRYLGDDGDIGCTFEDEGGADLSATSGTVTIRKADGSMLLDSAAMDGSGTLQRTFRYNLKTGAGGVITEKGVYTADYVMSNGAGTLTRTARQLIYVID
jgi:hypothetical protein